MAEVLGICLFSLQDARVILEANRGNASEIAVIFVSQAFLKFFEKALGSENRR